MFSETFETHAEADAFVNGLTWGDDEDVRWSNVSITQRDGWYVVTWDEKEV